MKLLRNLYLYSFVQALMFIVATTGFISPTPVYGEDSLWQALIGGKPTLYLRYRFEHVDDENKNKDANANTLRTALGYRTGLFYDFGAYLELEDVRHLGGDDFFDGVNGKTQFPTVIDPEDTEVNQAYLSYQGLDKTVFRAGRQIITYRKAPLHRFIGTVLWRQNWQTFDAFSVANQSLPETTLSYAFIWNSNRIFGEDNSLRSDTEMNTHLFNAQYTGLAHAKMEAYGYLIDNQNEDEPGVDFDELDSTKTFGARVYGAPPVTENIRVLYQAEYANQSDFADGRRNPGDDREPNDSDYIHLQLGGSYKILTAKVDYERLSGDGTYGFQTQLATGHAFQGWADKFLKTPRDGIQDLYFTVSATAFGAKFMAVYHEFWSDNLDYDYGSEIDLLATYTFMKHYTVGLKYADYMADNNTQNTLRNGGSLDKDISKFWAFAQLQF